MTIYDPTAEFEQISLVESLQKVAETAGKDAVDGNAALIQQRGMDGPDTEAAMKAVDEWRQRAIGRLTASEPGDPNTIWLDAQVEAHESVMDMIEEGEKLRSVKSRAAARSNKHGRKREKARSDKQDARQHGLSQGYDQAVESLEPFV